MNIIQCNFCKKPFQSFGGRTCGNCLEKIDKDFITVRDYIYENKRADMDTVSEETGVPKQIILYLMKEGRLIIDDPDGGVQGVLLCEVCKKPINTGRMCKDCKDKVASTMQKNIETRGSPEYQKGASTNIKATAKVQS
jgi:predicted amidophosphoribosyltransferase